MTVFLPAHSPVGRQMNSRWQFSKEKARAEACKRAIEELQRSGAPLHDPTVHRARPGDLGRSAFFTHVEEAQHLVDEVAVSPQVNSYESDVAAPPLVLPQ